MRTFGTMKIKTWFIDKEQDKAENYNMFFNFEYENKGEYEQILEADGCYIVYIDEVISESEKAIQVVIATGNIGNSKGWKTWVPKSVIIEKNMKTVA